MVPFDERGRILPYREFHTSMKNRNPSLREDINRLREYERMRQRDARSRAVEFRRAVNTSLPEAMHDEL